VIAVSIERPWHWMPSSRAGAPPIVIAWSDAGTAGHEWMAAAS